MMRIKTQFQLNILISIGLAMVIGGILFYSDRKINQEVEKNFLADRISKGVFDLFIVTGGYLSFGEDRPRIQAELKLASLKKLVRRSSPDEKGRDENLEIIANKLDQIGVFLDQIVSYAEKWKSSSGEEKVLFQEAIDRVRSRITAKGQETINQSFLLIQESNRNLSDVKRRAVFLVMLSILLGAVISGGISLLFSRRILANMQVLQKGTEMIAGGNLDQRLDLPSGDEIGRLAQAFNEMTGRLKTSCASIDDLNLAIIERKQAEEALRESEERLALAASGTQIGIFDWDVKTGEIRATEQNMSLLGLQIATTTTTTTTTTTLSQRYQFGDWIQCIYPEDQTRVKSEMDRCLAENRSFESEYRVIRPDKSVHWLATRGILQYDDQGLPTELLGILMDITERKSAEEALQESETVFRAISELNPFGVWECDPDGGVFYLSQSWLDMAGMTFEECRRFGWMNRYFPGEGEKMLEAWRQCREAEARWEYEHHILDKDGIERYVLSRGFPMCGLDGRITKWVGVNIDITEIKQVEEKLRKSDERFRLAVRATHIMVYDLDIRTMRLNAIHGLIDLLGYELSEAEKSLEWWDRQIHPSDQEACHAAFDRMHANPHDHQLLYRVHHKNGRILWVEDHATPICDDAGQVVRIVGTVKDITERKQAEEALRKAYDELELRVEERTAELAKANEDLQQLSSRLLSAQEEERKQVAGEIHDTLGSGLSAVKFKLEEALQLVGETAPDITGVLKSLFPVVQETIEECRRIQQDLRPSILDDLGLSATLSWFCRRFQSIYTHTRIDQGISVEEGEIPEALKIVIFRIAQEALNNLAKHSQADQVNLSLQKSDGHLEFVVRDNGMGFDLEKVLAKESTRKGLGLTSMKERAELSGGFFAIESVEGQGTIIRAWWSI